MHILPQNRFATVKTEGGILPADLLQRVAEGRPSTSSGQGLDGLTPESYHLFPGERINEAISRSWSRCLGAWRSFAAQREMLPPSDRGTSLTRERWLLILFHELGYGRLQFVGSLAIVGDRESAVGNRQSAVESRFPTPDSRFPTPDCWLERWSATATEQGVRALDALRDGVQEAIEVLGRGFLSHPANAPLRKALQSGDLTSGDYYRQLLRLVYRLIILFVAEDRDLLFPPEATPDDRARYERFYSLGRLREVAVRLRGSPHPDLYRGLRRVFELLRDGYPALGIPALGGFLFSPRATQALDAADLANAALLDAIRALTFVVDGKVRRAVDYRNLDSEELGSVYESLLELHPQIDAGAAAFSLTIVAGSERKTTGTHYTATPLVNQLLDSALEPVIAARVAEAKMGSREDPILSIRVLVLLP